MISRRGFLLGGVAVAALPPLDGDEFSTDRVRVHCTERWVYAGMNFGRPGSGTQFWWTDGVEFRQVFPEMEAATFTPDAAQLERSRVALAKLAKYWRPEIGA